MLALGKPNEESKRPGEESEKQNRDVIPERLDVLEFGREVALEIVLDDEDAEEVGTAPGAQDVPRQGRRKKRGERDGMKQPEGVAPALGEERPEKDSAAHENDARRAFRENREPEKKPEQDPGKPRC